MVFFLLLIIVVSLCIVNVKTKLLTFKQLIGLSESQPCGRAGKGQIDQFIGLISLDFVIEV